MLKHIITYISIYTSSVYPFGGFLGHQLRTHIGIPNDQERLQYRSHWKLPEGWWHQYPTSGEHHVFNMGVFQILWHTAQHKTVEMASLIWKRIDLRRRVPNFKAQPHLAEAPNHSNPTKVMTQNGILGCSPWSSGHTNILWKSLTAAWKSISKHLWPSVWWFETNVFMKTWAIVICNQDLMALAALALGKTGSYEKIWTHGTHKLLQNQCHNGPCWGFRKKSTRSNAGMLLLEENSSCYNMGVTTFHDNRRSSIHIITVMKQILGNPGASLWPWRDVVRS